MADTFIWYELATRDPAAAEAFYAAVVGWTAQPFGGGMAYTVLAAPDGAVGGIGPLPAEAWATPGWLGYIAVDDVDAVAERITRAGGAVVRPPDDIPGVGRFAVVADPQGVRFMLLRPTPRDAAPPRAFQAEAPGHIGWNELHSTDWAAGFAFYSALFGWEKLDAMDMGAMGTYQLFGVGGVPLGGMLNSPSFPRPSWLFYFNVDDIDAAQRRLSAAGGSVLHGPSEVPGGRWIIQAMDPQQVMFAVVGPRR
ncbi:VOC family protein [bacterium]|nr:VOC family protein [bacterium]